MSTPFKTKTQKKTNSAFRPAASTEQDPTSKGASLMPPPFQMKTGSSNMPDEVRGKMEGAFQTDFSTVNIHQNSKSATDVGALAYTQGNDVHFAPGQFKPNTAAGQELIGHELTHVVQQREGRVQPTTQAAGMPVNDEKSLESEADTMGRKAAHGEMLGHSPSLQLKGVDKEKGIRQNKSKSTKNTIQARFNPEDASDEMIGKEFTLNRELTSDNGTVFYKKGSTVTIKTWDNDIDKISISAIGSDNKKRNIRIKKVWLHTKNNTTAGLYEYGAGADKQALSVEKGTEEIAAHKKEIDDYKLYKNMDGYNKKLKRLEDRQKVRETLLNKKMIQETMFNSFDNSIKKWTDYYNKSIGKPNKWSNLDANIVKSMIWQESEAGTSGQFLFKNPRFEGDSMTRFNLMQAIDSSGANLTLMMNEMDPALAKKYKINDVRKDLLQSQSRLNELKKKTTLSSAESKELADLNKRSGNGKTWDYYYWTDNRFYSAWKEFNKQPKGDDRNIDYDFWIRTGIAWLFKKRKSVPNWGEAIRAYNGGGQKARDYKSNVIKRRDAAKSSSKSGKEFIPKREY